MGFPRPEYWCEFPFPSPEDFPDPGIELMSPALQVNSLLLSHQRSPYIYMSYIIYIIYICMCVCVFYMRVMLKTVYLTTSEYTCYGMRADLAWSTMVRKIMGLKV